MKYRQQITQVRVAYVMMVHSIYIAQQPGAKCRAQLNFVPRHARVRVFVVARECRGAKLDYFPIILILPKPGRNYCIT